VAGGQHRLPGGVRGRAGGRLGLGLGFRAVGEHLLDQSDIDRFGVQASRQASSTRSTPLVT
jgi:hypothetical protein